MNIYPVNRSFQDVLARANEYAEKNGGDTDSILENLLTTLGEQRDEACIGLMYDIKTLEAEEVTLKSVIKEIQDKGKAVKERIEKRKQTLATVLGGQSLSDGVVKTTKAVSASLVVFGEVPNRYVSREDVPAVPATTKRVVNNKQIKADLQSGSLIACDFARIVEKKSVK